MQILKKIWIYIVQNHIHLMAGIIFICSILYILQENDVIKPQTIIYLNFVLFGILVVWIRNIMKGLCIDKWVVIYILLILCVLNKLYDKVVFQKLFHFEQQIFVVVGVVVAAFFCFFPLIVKKIKGMYKKLPADDKKHVMTESDQNLEKQYEERRKQQEYGSYYPAGKKEHQKSWKRTRVKRNEYRIRRSRIPRGGSKNRKNELTIIAEKKSFWFFILSLLIVLPIVMTLGIFIMYTKSEIEIEEIVENFTLQNAINIMLSFLNFAVPFMEMANSPEFNNVGSIYELLDIYGKYLSQYTEKLLKPFVSLQFEADPLLSLLSDTAMEKQQDITQGGAKYQNLGLTSVGMGTVVNSILNIRDIVFKQKIYITGTKRYTAAKF